MSESGQLTPPGLITKKIKTPDSYSEQEYHWALEPHVCRRCFGRLVSRREGDETVFACSCCGLSGVGKPGSVCCCGIRLRRSTSNGTTASLVDAGVRCHPNEVQTPDFPALYVASYRGA